MKKVIIAVALLSMASFSVANEKCSMKPRVVQYKGETVDVHVNINGNTRMVFPEKSLIGLDPEVFEGIEVHELDSELSNRRIIRPSVEGYNSLMFVYGESGKEYVLNLISSDCSDSQVTIQNFEASESTLEAKRQLDERKTKTLNSYMYKYIQSGKTMPLPEGFRREMSDTSGGQLVMEVGSVKFYSEETWRGINKDGLFIRVENHGREAQKIDITQIDFNQREIIEVFGQVDTIAMMPISQTLAPSAQYISDLYDNSPNVGYLLIASEK
jgi:hypothetical protein